MIFILHEWKNQTCILLFVKYESHTPSEKMFIIAKYVILTRHENKCLEYFAMINILPIEGWFSYFTNERIKHACFYLWSMKVILHQKEYFSLRNMQFWHVMKNRCLKYFMMISILPKSNSTIISTSSGNYQIIPS